MSKRRKPTGSTGFVSYREDGRGPRYQRLPFPESKADIERMILDGCLRALAGSGDNPYALAGEPAQNEENNFDFTLPTARGPEYLDLVEVADLSRSKGSYEAASDVL
jgi:hypothetical protein